MANQADTNMMKNIVVQKYGGSSLADIHKIRLVAQRIAETHKHGYPVVVVVSAMGSTTDTLLEQARQVAASPQKRELDMLLTAGERISMSLVTMALQDLGVDAVSLTGSQSGILTSDSHFNARIIDVRPVRIEDALDRGQVVIVAGFQGMSYKREITTLGRGGSDTTAVALAAALKARYCEICSDVAGVYSADPRKIQDARLLPALDYDEMEEMGEAGAAVLNPDAIEFARSCGMEVRLSSTFDPERCHGTLLLRAMEHPQQGKVRSVSVRAAVTHLHLRYQSAEKLREALSVLEAKHIPLESVSISGCEKGTAELLLDPEKVPDWQEMQKALYLCLNDAVSLDARLATVSLVGSAIAAEPGTLIRAMTALAKGGLSWQRADESRNRITFLMDAARAQEAASRLHQALIVSPDGEREE